LAVTGQRQGSAADRQFLAALAAPIRQSPVFRGFSPYPCVTCANWHGSCEYQAGSPVSNAIRH